MTIDQSFAILEAGLDQLIVQLNDGRFDEVNEATLQHHLAMNIHLISLGENQPNLTMSLEKTVRRAEDVWPKTGKDRAAIDIFFQQIGDGTKCAVEMKCFQKGNQREPNNRYDAYADLANLECYLQDGLADVGALVVATDHRHYFDNGFKAHSPATADFSLREGHQYVAGRVLSYRTLHPQGAEITLRGAYRFTWRNLARTWRILLLRVDGPIALPQRV